MSNMDIKLQLRWDELDMQKERTADETAEYIALSIAWELTDRTGCEWDDVDADIQHDTIREWTKIAKDIIQYGAVGYSARTGATR